jgi:hypothetical protein
MGMYSAEAPPPRDYGKETRETLEAQIALAPDLFAAEASQEYGRPAEARLNLQVLRDLMRGSEGQPGLLELYERDIMPGLARADVAGLDVTREGDIAAVERLGQRATEAFRQANPEQAALMAELNRQAQQELAAGASLPPAMARELEQQVRGAQAARGMGFGVSDISQEALVKGLQAEQLQRRRQAFAQQMVGLNAATAADPFMAILGRPGVGIAAGQGLAAQGQGMAPQQVFNPESAYAGSLAAGNYNAALNASIASANARAGIAGAGLQAAGSILGGFASRPPAAPPACWVAREVYGISNPMWVLFREWLLNDSPGWFRNLYIKHGQRFAGWLSKNEWLKPSIKKWMDSRIKKLIG